MNKSIADIRQDYSKKTLLESDVQSTPIAQFEIWWNEASESKIDEINAFTLATSDNGLPHARIVLLKGFNADGFIFFTNYTSNKGKEIAANHNVAATFFWKELERQVRIEGKAEKISAAESDAYFNSRPFGSRIGAWASPQSQKINDREILEENVKQLQNKLTEETIVRPEHWGGYVIKPQTIEFWQGRPSRLHDRLLYTKHEAAWKIERLAP